MKQPDEAWWANARRARDQLVAQLLAHPAISLIDIGVDPENRADTPVLRVHVQQSVATVPPVPNQISGIPVRVIRGDYTLQRDSSSGEAGEP